MAERVFCIGNGESRSPVDLIKLRPHGKIYGCNGLYRDFTPDVLTSVDGPMMHEIYQSGYADKNELWLRDWNAVPGMTYSSVVFAGLSQEEIEIGKKNFKLNENKRGDRQMYVFHGSSISGQVGLIRRMASGEQIEKKQINHTGCYVSWQNPDDKVNSLSDLIPGKPDRGWACGATSAWVALTQNKDLKELIMIGHDLKSNTDNINNMYKSTDNYGDGRNKPIPHVNWVSQWNTLMQEFPKVKFIKVNPDGIRGNTPVSSNMEEWNTHATKGTLEYWNYEKLNESFNCI
jgi:hypothetical protein